MRWNEEHVLTDEGLDGIALRYGLLYEPAPASDALIDGLRKRWRAGQGSSLPMTTLTGAPSLYRQL